VSKRAAGTAAGQATGARKTQKLLSRIGSRGSSEREQWEHQREQREQWEQQREQRELQLLLLLPLSVRIACFS
jgi:hypothetical protein